MFFTNSYMKKISQKDLIILSVMLGLVFLYLLFIYFYEPFEKKLSAAQDEKESLETQMSPDYVISVQSELDKLKNELSLLEEEKKESDALKTISKNEQENILLNIGETATSLDINLVKFEEKAHIDSFEYSIIPYEIKARGDNSDLIIMLNTLYEKYNYFHIDDVNMRKLKVVSELERPENEVNIENSITDNWSEQFLDLVTMDFPVHLLNNEDETKKEADTSESEKTPTKLNSELQLDFTIYFISKIE